VPKNYFDERMAERCETYWPELFDPAVVDPAVSFAQSSFSHHYWVVDGRLETFSAPFRYVWPSELDLMARLAGLTLRERWSDWSREPFTSESRTHVSVWEKTS
jgi:hypothetical protein